jgi:hypothetical protein
MLTWENWNLEVEVAKLSNYQLSLKLNVTLHQKLQLSTCTVVMLASCHLQMFIDWLQP